MIGGLVGAVHAKEECKATRMKANIVKVVRIIDIVKIERISMKPSSCILYINISYSHATDLRGYLGNLEDK